MIGKKRNSDHFLLTALIVLLQLFTAACSDDTNSSTSTGIDVSHYQGDINWKALKKSGVSFSYIKVSEGKTITDPKFAANWADAQAAGVTRGGYHLFVPGDDGPAQARQFLNSLASIGANYNGALPPALDIEPIHKSGLSAAKKEIQKWLTQVEDTLGCKPIIYTSPYPWNDEFPDDFTGYQLWLADYADTPTIPEGWSDWLFWQHSKTSEQHGIEGDVDADRFNGSKIKLFRTTCVAW